MKKIIFVCTFVFISIYPMMRRNMPQPGLYPAPHSSSRHLSPIDILPPASNSSFSDPSSMHSSSINSDSTEAEELEELILLKDVLMPEDILKISDILNIKDSLFDKIALTNKDFNENIGNILLLAASQACNYKKLKELLEDPNISLSLLYKMNNLAEGKEKIFQGFSRPWDGEIDECIGLINRKIEEREREIEGFLRYPSLD